MKCFHKLISTSSLVVLFITGCAGPKTPIPPKSAPKPLSDAEWTGTWTATITNFFDFKSPVALVINSNGTGEAITSNIWPAYQDPNKHVTSSKFLWRKVSPTQLALDISASRTVAGQAQSEFAGKASVPLYSTQNGLQTKALIYSNAVFSRVSSKADPKITDKIVNQVSQDAAAIKASYAGRGFSGHQTAGMVLAGASIGAAAEGNLDVSKKLMDQAAATYSGIPQVQVDKLGNYDPNKYFTGGKGRAKESTSNLTGTDAQFREAYPDGKAWDVQALNGSIWKVYYGAPTSIKDQMLASGNLVTPSGNDRRNCILRGPYKPYSGMKVGLVAIDPP